MDKTKITGIAFGAVYARNFEVSYKFYSEVLGLKKLYDMGDRACFFELPDDTGLYLQGRNSKVEYAIDTMRTSFVFNVPSASAMYEKLRAADVKFIHDAPIEMGPGNYWFMFYDPSGNILEVLGDK